ncbi:MAG: 23S rRNA (pseudouridine(1915)-N(3))-methyltransferase RlmH [Lachnospiraceae bacterium]|nr:23S rRNA (pseudouridine(1915)-N(3))-methyltransferase RlmH [Lachnospiraceae bacterium]
MERIDILAAGKIRESYYRDAMAEYEKRLSRYVKLNIIEVADGPDKKAEALRMLEKLPEDAYIITLEINGRALSSEELSQKISELESSGRSRIVFIIGGPEGLHSDILSKADFRLSFSKMTFPHPLMRVILLEQIYRAYRIMKGEPYHK